MVARCMCKAQYVMVWYGNYVCQPTWHSHVLFQHGHLEAELGSLAESQIPKAMLRPLTPF